MVNGTGVPCNKYEAVFKHFASWGYIVVGNDYGTNWDGKHTSETLDFALNTKEIADMIDTDKIAVGGHSQGGMGAFNAINQYENGNRYKVIGVTHAPKTNGVVNIRLEVNPEPGNETPAYIRPTTDEIDKKTRSKRLNGWKLSLKDNKKVKKIIRNSKKTKK